LTSSSPPSRSPHNFHYIQSLTNQMTYEPSIKLLGDDSFVTLPQIHTQESQRVVTTCPLCDAVCPTESLPHHLVHQHLDHDTNMRLNHFIKIGLLSHIRCSFAGEFFVQFRISCSSPGMILLFFLVEHLGLRFHACGDFIEFDEDSTIVILAILKQKVSGYWCTLFNIFSHVWGKGVLMGREKYIEILNQYCPSDA
jgi:hypothetical protein